MRKTAARAKSAAQPKKRGRPPIVPLKDQRAKVQLWTAGGISEEHQAQMLGISRNTLRKTFASELANGAALEQATNLERLRDAADKGNVSAMKHLDVKFAATAAAADWNGDRQPNGDEPMPRKDNRVSKKELGLAAAEAAMTESGDWGADLVPEGIGPTTSTRQ